MGVTTTDLAAWLTQIWDEDEKSVERAVGDSPSALPIVVDNYGYLTMSRSVMLARIAADREILADYERLCFDDPFRRTDYFRGQRDALEYTLKHLAEPYADRPGYREEWKP